MVQVVRVRFLCRGIGSMSGGYPNADLTRIIDSHPTLDTGHERLQVRSNRNARGR